MAHFCESATYHLHLGLSVIWLICPLGENLQKLEKSVCDCGYGRTKIFWQQYLFDGSVWCRLLHFQHIGVTAVQYMNFWPLICPIEFILRNTYCQEALTTV